MLLGIAKDSRAFFGWLLRSSKTHYRRRNGEILLHFAKETAEKLRCAGSKWSEKVSFAAVAGPLFGGYHVRSIQQRFKFPREQVAAGAGLKYEEPLIVCSV